MIIITIPSNCELSSLRPRPISKIDSLFRVSYSLVGTHLPLTLEETRSIHFRFVSQHLDLIFFLGYQLTSITQTTLQDGSMADQAKALGLKCPNDGTFYACPDAEASFVGCCTTDPCEDNSGTCPDNNLVAATFDRENPVQNFSHECLDGGKWYDCPDLETPFVGCCSQDACLSRCPVEDLRAAVLGDDNGLVFKMKGSESTGNSESAKSTATSRATSTGETTHTSSLTISTTTTFFPTATTSNSGVAQTTVVVEDPQGKNDLSESQEVGIGVTAGVLGCIALGCIVHRVIVHNRKGRPGYPHRTDHDPLWERPPSPIELNALNAPGTRKCGLDRVPGEATRPGSWDDAANNAAEAELTGLPGPRRVRSAEPAALLNDATSQASGQGRGSGQTSLHSLPLPDVRGRPVVDGPRSAGSAGPQFKRQRAPQGWVTGKEHAKYHGHDSDNGDFSVDIEGHGQGYSANRQHRYPAARSDDQLSRFVSYPPPADVRPAPRSDGAGEALNLNHYAPKTYQPYRPSVGPSGLQAQSGAREVDPPREVYELPAEPVVNSGELTGDLLVARRASMFNKGNDYYKADADNSGEECAKLEEQGEKQVVESNPGVSSAATEKSTSQVAATESAVASKTTDEEVVSKDDGQTPRAAAPATSGAEEAPRLDATGGLPIFGSDSLRPTQTTNAPSTKRKYRKPYVTSVHSGYDSEVARTISSDVPASSVGENVQRPTVTDNVPASRPSGLTTSAAAPTSLAPQTEPPRFPDYDEPPPFPPVLAAPRRQTSELHMNVPTEAVQPDPAHPSADRQFAGPGSDPLHAPREYPARVPAYRAERPAAQNNGMYDPRHPANLASDRPIHRSHHPGNLNASGPRTAIDNPPIRNDASQANSQARQPYAQEYQTRIYHPHRVNPRRGIQPPANSARARGASGNPGPGAQPQPAYRSYQGWQELNRGVPVPGRDLPQRSPAYPPVAYSGANYRGYGTTGRQQVASTPRSEFSESDSRQTHGAGSELSSHVESYFASRRELLARRFRGQ